VSVTNLDFQYAFKYTIQFGYSKSLGNHAVKAGKWSGKMTRKSGKFISGKKWTL